MKIKNIASVDVSEWDDLVIKTYGRPYSYQQQNGCKERGIDYIHVPYTNPEDYEDDSIPEEINGDDMGVSFAAWLARDPKAPVAGESDYLDLFWERNFYPSVEMLANDLHARGLLPAGELQIVIDW